MLYIKEVVAKARDCIFGDEALRGNTRFHSEHVG